ncbi:MAG: GNAT family N-acetyltransferase [Pseudomonadota bacterium]
MNYKITEYKEEYKSDLIRALVELQTHEHNLSNTRKSASTMLCEEYLLELIEKIKITQGKIFCLLQDEAFTGFISYYIEQDNTIFEEENSKSYAYISDICVLKKFQNNGIAGNLLNKVYEDLRSKRFKGRIRINTLANNIAAVRTYEKYGFKPYEIIYEKEI